MYALYFDRAFDVLEGFMSSTLNEMETANKQQQHVQEIKEEQEQV